MIANNTKHFVSVYRFQPGESQHEESVVEVTAFVIIKYNDTSYMMCYCICGS